MSTEQVRLDGLLFSTDAKILGVMNGILASFAIKTEVIGELNSALDAVTHRRLDAIIVDWKSVYEPKRVVSVARKSSPNSNSTIVAVVDRGAEDCALLAGANFMIHKPLNFDHAQRCMRAAYGTILQNRRRLVRVPVDMPTVVREKEGRRLEARVCDISIGGMALRCKESLELDRSVAAFVSLPGTNALIYLSGEVANTDGKERAGIRFCFIPDEDLTVLKRWLANELTRLDSAEMPEIDMKDNVEVQV